MGEIHKRTQLPREAPSHSTVHSTRKRKNSDSSGGTSCDRVSHKAWPHCART